MHQQSRSTQEQATKESRRRKLETEEEERRRLHEALKPIRNARKGYFYEIPAGEFLMGEEKVLTKISKSFEMMDVHVTQFIWAQLKIAMGETNVRLINPSVFSDYLNRSGDKSSRNDIIVKIDDFEFHMQINNPVESINTDTKVQDFLNGLNELSKYGDSQIQDLLRDLFPGHQKGDHYDLPTEAQWEYVMTNLGKANKPYFDSDDDAELNKYAYYDESNGVRLSGPWDKTLAVASLQPRIINGKPFFDLEGNVADLVKDLWDGVSSVPGGVDPLGAKGDFRIARGGGWAFGSKDLRYFSRWKVNPRSSHHSVGIRLIRTRP